MIAYNLFRFGKFFEDYKAFILLFFIFLAAMFIVPNISSIAEKFGLQTRAELKAQVAAQKVVNEQTTSANANLSKELDKEKQSSSDTVTILSKKNETDLKLSTELSNIKTKREKVITKVITRADSRNTSSKISSPDKPSQPTLSLNTITVSVEHPYTQSDIDEISTANIDSIWETYNKVQGATNG